MSKKLSEYEKRRDTGKSGEPAGRQKSSKGAPMFVIQKHDASSLHYDFRLEIDGVLVSWAVPKGPSTNPADKRLAIRTDDHPLDYADFEGVIPEGQYGAGPVLVWDKGTIESLDDDGLKDALDDGHIKVRLKGEKLKGGYALTRTSDKGAKQEKWLLIKMDDDEADARRNPVSTEPESVKTGRHIEDISDDESDEESEKEGDG